MSDSKVRVYDKQGRYIGTRGGDLAVETKTSEENAAVAKRNAEAREKEANRPGLGALAAAARKKKAPEKPKVNPYNPESPFS